MSASRFGDWEVVIGLETHAQLSTRSKIFSGASTAFGATANTQASAVDLALPGVLPVANRGAVERALKFGLAVGADINRRSIFARKNYFYPDLPQGYQISQYKSPIVGEGKVIVDLPESGGQITVGIERLHLEQDAGKSLHDQSPTMSFVDLNRSGVALMEIVSKPDMRSSEEARAYVTKLRTILRYLGTCDGNMDEGSLRADVNVSVRRPGGAFGTRCEIKNVNSIRFMGQAIEYEARRQIGILEDGGTIDQETRLYDAAKGETRSMRSKEEAHDYRYFPDPDLPPLLISEQWVEEIRGQMTELPRVMASRFVSAYGLPEYDATTMTQSKGMAAYFEATAQLSSHAKLASNWIMGEVSRRLNATELNIEQSSVSAEQLGAIIRRIADNTISNSAARQVFDALWSEAQPAGNPAEQVDAVIEAKGLKQMNDSGALEAIIDEVLAANPKNVEEYKAGNTKALNGLVGPIMKASKGKANPAQVNELLKKKLG